jgi:hypothetical protein
MSETKWTPGPWRIEPPGDLIEDGYSVLAECGSFCITVPAETHDYEHGSRDEADARLIAAAPEMYEALLNLSNEMAFLLKRNPSKDGGLYRVAVDEARAALAKARGEA